MPFEQIGGGTMITGRNSITLARMLAMRSAMSLEAKGLRMSRGPVLWKRLKAEFDIKGGRKEVTAWLVKEIDRLKELIEQGDEGAW